MIAPGSTDPSNPPTLGDIVRARATDCENRTAIEFEGRATSYAELRDGAFRIANALIASGLEPGDRVAVLARNCDTFFSLLIGSAVAGAVLMPMNWRLSPPEIAYLLADSDARLLFADEASLPLARAALEGGGQEPPIVIIDRSDGPGALSDWLRRGSDGDPAVPVRPGDVAIQLYTSGTTGRPKGAMLSHHGLNCVRLSQPPAAAWSRWTADDVCLVSMPLFHIGGIGTALAAIYHGARMVILSDFVPDLVLDQIERGGIKKLFLVPAAFRILLDHPRTKTSDFSGLDHILYGSSPITAALLDEAMAVFSAGFVQVYGMTETSGTVVALPPEDHGPGKPHLRGAAGKPLAGVEIAIFDASGGKMPAGGVGEIGIRSGAAMAGYWKRSEESAKVFTPDGFLLSGDAGYLDAEGYLFICDRIKDMIISGGENVYAAEVESIIAGHPAIREAAIVGVPDERWGEAVHAVIVLEAGETLGEDEFRRWCRARLAGFKTPKSMEIVAALPRNPAGKVLRRAIRERMAGTGEQKGDPAGAT